MNSLLLQHQCQNRQSFKRFCTSDNADSALGIRSQTSALPVVLLIDDEVQIRRLLRVTLEANGYRIREATTGQFGLTEAAQHRLDAIILELNLPDMDGMSFLHRLREWSHIPVIVLSSRGNESDKVMALDTGADDYLTKPFGTGELLARLRVAQRHVHPADLTVFKSGRLEVDLVSRTVRIQGKAVNLTPTEYALLHLLVHHAGRVVRHRQILREVWGANCVEQMHYLHVYMARLREKIEENPFEPQVLINESGVGYRLMAEMSTV